MIAGRDDPAPLPNDHTARGTPPARAVILNRYEVLGTLGRGAMGEVLQVRDLQTSMEYALKRVPPDLARDTAQMDMVRQNFTLVSQLTHPHIATTRYLETDPASYETYIIMDLVRGMDLRTWLAKEQRKQPALPLPVALVIAEQIASALDYAHSQPIAYDSHGKPRLHGILHRDLKPANVMVEVAREYRPGVPYLRLVDFGLAAEIQASLQSLSVQHDNALAGTPAYMAPEQWQGRTLTRGVDQWALAVIIYEMVSGHRPFAAPTQEALERRVCEARPEQPPTLPPAQWAALRHAFELDRRLRYPSCMALVKALGYADASTRGLIRAPLQDMPEETPAEPRLSAAPPPVAPARPRPPSVSPGSPVLCTPEPARAAVAAAPLPSSPARAAGPEETSLVSSPPPAASWFGLAVWGGLIAVLVSVGFTLWYFSPGPRHREALKKDEPSVPVPAENAQSGPSSNRPRAGIPPDRLDLGNGVFLDLVCIRPGTFLMGCPDSEAQRQADETRHVVTLTQPFYMGKHEVTQEEYAAVMGGGESQFRNPRRPVETVSWSEAQEFCAKLRVRTGREVRLPTEAEWEYACRAGRDSAPFHAGPSLGAQQANFDARKPYGDAPVGEYRQGTTPVGSFPPNAFGLYDMHGNVVEWCQDFYGEYPTYPERDPKGPKTGRVHVLRGGSWFEHASGLRSACRFTGGEDAKSNRAGFRVAVTAAPAAPVPETSQERTAIEAAVKRMADEEREYREQVVRQAADLKRRGEGAASRLRKEVLRLGNGVTLALVLVPAGSFTMGSPGNEEGRDGNEVQHRVTLTQPFFMGIHEVTQAQYEKVLGANPSHFRGPDLPVENVSWEDCQAFCAKLGELVGKPVRLPTEAEWEYASRAGVTAPFHFGETLNTALANYDGTRRYGSGPRGEARLQTLPVGSFPPNLFGLYDMHGNVLEWCQDYVEEYVKQPVSDPTGPAQGQRRAARGGSWASDARWVRCAQRLGDQPGTRANVIGFRVVIPAGSFGGIAPP